MIQNYYYYGGLMQNQNSVNMVNNYMKAVGVRDKLYNSNYIKNNNKEILQQLVTNLKTANTKISKAIQGQ